MSEHWFGIVEMTLFLGVPLVWGVWELLKVRRELARDRERAATEDRPAATE